MAEVSCKANEYNLRCTIQQYTLDQNASTGEVSFEDSTWSDQAETWCKFRQLSGRDYVIAQQSGYVASHMIEMRYRPGIQQRLTRIIVKGVKLYVVHANNVDNRNVKLEILCRSEDMVT